MKRLALPVAALLLAAVRPEAGAAAAAQSGARLTRCLNEAIASCDRDFGGQDYRTLAIRGWCYMIRGAVCYVADPEA